MDKQKIIDNLAALKEQVARIDNDFKSNEAFQDYKKRLNAAGKIIGSPGRARGKAKEDKQTGQVKKSTKVVWYEKFVTMKNIVPQFASNIDCHLVKFWLFKHLNYAGFSFIINEFKYQSTVMDTFAIQNDRAVEFEIKLSREDYLNDFSKVIYSGKYYNKHTVLAHGQFLISKFFFVVPENMIDISETPPYAGLIWFKIIQMQEAFPIAEKGNTEKVVIFRVVKYPMLLHKEFLPAATWKTIAQRFYIRNLNLTYRYAVTRFGNNFKIFTTNAEKVEKQADIQA